MENFIQFELDAQQAVDRYLVIAPQERDYGHDPEFQLGKIRVYLGDKPLCINLLKIYQKKGLEVPADLKIFDEYDTWLVSYSVQIMQTGGFKHLSQVGLQIKYASDELSPNVIILQNMPTTTIKQLGGGDLSFETGLGLNGQLETALDNLPVSPGLDLGFGGKLEVTGNARVSFNVHFNVLSAKIVSVGTGNTYGEWAIDRDSDRMLVGDQLFTQTILTTKGISTLEVEARVYSTVVGPFGSFPIRLEGPWTKLSLNMVL